MHSSTTRFSDRVENYIKYRPSYPKEIISYFLNEGILKSGYSIADIGSGTGISTEIFLKENYDVIGVEPNKDMREAAERLLLDYKNFKSVDGTAEQTGLPNESIDLIICAQAFHWFDIEKARKEFKRILKKDRYTSLIWNVRKEDTDFLKDYEGLLQKFGTDYKDVKHNNITNDVILKFFGNQMDLKVFYNVQMFDFEGLKGRLLSSSYAPNENDSNSPSMLDSLKKVFEKHQVNGKVAFEYDTAVYSAILK
jgi:SAM-dependent methyltransferase